MSEPRRGRVLLIVAAQRPHQRDEVIVGRLRETVDVDDGTRQHTAHGRCVGPLLGELAPFINHIVAVAGPAAAAAAERGQRPFLHRLARIFAKSSQFCGPRGGLRAAFSRGLEMYTKRPIARLGTGLARTEILSRLSLVKSVAHGRKWANKGQCPEREGAVRLSAAALFDFYFGTMTSARISATTDRLKRRAGARILTRTM
mmetsp:Transcript_7513/g.24082  ORF Transcript_7513/g.24082 Transcript_7513/m.24082 type:complete len:201 (-) Transcript_7513:1237-1839(-)